MTPFISRDLASFRNARAAFAHPLLPIRNYALTDEWLVQYAGFSENDWKAINRGNAERLFPRLKS